MKHFALTVLVTAAMLLSRSACAADARTSPLVTSLAFQNNRQPRLAFAEDSDFFLHASWRTAFGSEEHFYAGQWRPQGIKKLENAAVFQSWSWSQDEKLYQVSWRQLDPDASWAVFFDWLKGPELYRAVTKLSPADKPSVLDGHTITIEINYKNIDTRTAFTAPDHEEELLRILTRLEQIFGFKFRGK